MRTVKRSTLFGVLGWIALVAGALAQPQAPTDPELGAAPTVESVQTQLDAAQGGTDVDDATKQRIVDFFQRAIDQLRLAEQHETQRAEFERLAADAPARLETVRTTLSQPPLQPDTSGASDLPLAQLEQRLSEHRSALQTARDEADALQAEATRRTERRTAIPELLARARRSAEEAESQFRAPAAEGESARVTEARRIFQRSRLRALNTEVRSLEAETASYDARRELLAARRDQAQRRVAEAEAQVNAWQEVVRVRREAEAARQQEQARQDARLAAQQHPILQTYAARNQELSTALAGGERVTGASQKLTNASADLSATRAQLTALQDKYALLKRRLDAAGLNKATGKLLRSQYSELPRATSIRARASAVRNRAEDAATDLIEYEDDRDQLTDIARETQKIVDALTEADAPPDTDLTEFIRSLVTARRDLLDRLVNDYSALSNQLLSLEVATNQYADLVEDARSFIGERILWVPSVSIENTLDWPDAVSGVSWLFSPTAWGNVLATARAQLVETTARVSLAAFVALLSLIIAVRAKRQLRSLGERTRRVATDHMDISWFALGLTILASLPLATAVLLLAWLLDSVATASPQAAAFSQGFLWAGIVIFPLHFLKQLMRAQGLADAHFRWRDATRGAVCRTVMWAMPILAISIGVTAIIRNVAPGVGEEIETDVLDATLGRGALSVALVTLAIAAFRLTGPKRSAVGGFLTDNPDGWLARTRPLWRPIAALTPVVILVFAWLGYQYTAQRLTVLYLESFWIVIALTVLHGMMQRWLFLARRRLAIQEAKRRREAAAAQSGAQTPEKESGKPIEEERIDLPAISLRTTQLFRTTIAALVIIGFYAVWSDTLPALRFLDRVEIWPSIRFVEEAEAVRAPATDSALAADAQSDGASGGSAGNGDTGISIPSPTNLASGDTSDSSSSADTSVPIRISLADIGLAIVLVAITIIAMRQAPSLIEIVILQRLPLDAGARYALSTVIRYIIVLIGGLAAFNAIGVSWSTVQWLAAALTFGLAFGLQEIFANFISGLIILAERPIRVGDTVTVSGVTGEVQRVRMRATTITDWDRKELVIPNKTFITSDVINWTLSDPIMRVIIPVGVSYSSDVDKVRDLLLEIATESRIALDEPPPRALFLGFGDSTLNFELRVFIDHIDNFVKVKSDLHMRIIKKFRQNNVEIAFPQRDLHIRSVDRIENALPISRSDAEAEAKSDNAD